MDNVAIADQLELLSKLLDIHGEDPDKARHFAAAAFSIEKLPYPLTATPREKWRQIRGIGSGTTELIAELIENGRLSRLEELISKTPEGVIAMLSVKGIGPKKIHTIWKEMGIESIGELLYACQENRLTLFKGFGEKTLQAVAESIQFMMQHQGHFLYAEAEAIFPPIELYLQKLFGEEQVMVTGHYRRQSNTLNELAFVVTRSVQDIKPKFITAQPPELLEETEDSLLYLLKNGLRLRIHASPENGHQRLLETSCSEEFLDAFNLLPDNTAITTGKTLTEQALFEKKGLPYIIPCRREKASVLFNAEENSSTPLIQASDIKGLIHCHSNWSDGMNSLEEMAQACLQKNWEYMVISDHSVSAFYAKGLNAERVAAQHQLIDQLNRQLAPFKIFKSIESDILNDGSLDYPNEVLSSFDLVIASVHSNLRMSQEKANARLLKAIQNPFTAILGHMTGRLLLSREGYPVNHQLIIDACASNGVSIELNAHPRRLDIDWYWIDKALEKGVLISINPDAHNLEGMNDVRYGVLAAQKAGLIAERNLSSFSLSQFEAWLSKRKTS